MVEVPQHVRVQLAHAAVQHLADDAALRMLHLKGAALDASLRYPGRASSDADVLLPPDDAERLVDVLVGSGWRLQTSFRSNSSFEHAAALHHHVWGDVDVHRWFPGPTVDPWDAFEVFWRDHQVRPLGGRACAVPSLPAQALVVVLHAARPANRARAHRDVEAAWLEQPDRLRREVLDLVHELGAEVAFAAATGGLDRYRDHRHYLQWRVASQGGTRTEEWRGRMRAAPSRRHAARIALQAPLVNTQHLAVVLGRAPTPADVAHEFVHRCRRVLAQEWRERWRT